jgi:RHS repeat-associated protein
MQLDIFGVPRFEAGTAEDCPWRWPGQYEDGGTGLSYNRWRFYSHSRGEYLSADPLGLDAGAVHYAYADDVGREFDPLGLSVADALAAAVSSAGRPLLPGQTAHHIIQRNGGADAARAEAVLQRSNPAWTRDSASNGAALWGTQDSQIRAGAPFGHPGRGTPGARPPGYHGGGVHGPAAQRRIADLLERAERLGMDPERVLRQVGERMETGRFRCR